MNILVIGATGLVGRSLVKLLDKSDIKIEKIEFVASSKSKGNKIFFRGKTHIIKTINNVVLKPFNVCLLTASNEVSKSLVDELLSNNIIVIDNSSIYRNKDTLTIPEYNFRLKKLYTNPNCSIIQSIIPLIEINKEYDIESITYNTYQSLSGMGNKYKENIVKECIPQIGELENSNTTEESKMINETKILLNNFIHVSANCVRVPVIYGHLVNVTVKLEKDIKIDEFINLISKATIYNEEYRKVDLKDNVNIYTFRAKRINYATYSFYTYANNTLRGASYNSFLILKKLIKAKESML